MLNDAELDASITSDILGSVTRAAHLPEIGRGPGRIRCASGVGAFQDGALALDHISLDSPLLTMTGSGKIDIPGGTLDLHLKPVLRLGATDVSTAVSLTGDIRRPVAALQAGDNGRFGIQIGRLATPAGGCEPLAANRRKPPNSADLLRALGLFR